MKHLLVGCALVWLMAAVGLAAGPDPRLIQAVKVRNAQAVRVLLKQRVDVNAPQTDGTTALHWSAHLDDLGTAEALIRGGARVNAATDTGVTPLYLACTNRSAAMVEKLADAGADPNAKLLDGETVLMECARTGNARAVRTLLAHSAVVDSKESFHDQTALMWAAANQHPEVVQALVERGADVKARSRSYTQTVTGGSNATARVEGNYTVTKGGSTPLLFAARVGDVDSARHLLAAGADVNDALPTGVSALVLAAHSGHGGVAGVLLDKGADPNAAEGGYTALHAAVLRGDGGLVRSLLSHGANPNAAISKGMPLRRTSQDFELPVGLIGATPYALAARFLEVEIMRVLAAAGADSRTPLRDGTTPLMAAAGTGAPGQADRRGLSVLDGGRMPDAGRVAEAVKAALELGSDVNRGNRTGDTALHTAASLGYDAVVQLLVDNGATINAKNTRGQTPLAVLIGGRRGRSDGANAFVDTYNQSAHPSTVALLRKLGATE